MLEIIMVVVALAIGFCVGHAYATVRLIASSAISKALSDLRDDIRKAGL
jgi:hypothetical protein